MAATRKSPIVSFMSFFLTCCGLIQAVLALHTSVAALASSHLPVATSSAWPPNDLPATPFDALTRSGLPEGLLPKVVSSFAIDEAGNFEVHLAHPCRSIAPVWGGVALRYDSVLRGTITWQRIAGLQGVAAEVASRWVWVNVVDISANGPSDDLHFIVMYLKLSFPCQIPRNVFDEILPCDPASGCQQQHQQQLRVSRKTSAGSLALQATSLAVGRSMSEDSS